MFVKYSKGTFGIVEYLKFGVAKDRDFSRDEMDYRNTLHGNIEELDIILKTYNKPKAKGDNYKHFVITFENENALKEDLINITNEFKKFAKAGYKDDELYFYAESHIPKLKGYPFMSGEYNSRKPHVHVIIPVYNLYTGNKGYNFNITTFKYREYLDLFSRKMNHKYNLNSPLEPQNRRPFKGMEEQLTRKVGVEYKGSKLWIKKEIFEMIINRDLKTIDNLRASIKVHMKDLIDQVSYGNINKDILVIKYKDKMEKQQTLALKDYCFSKEFLSQSEIVKNKNYNKYITNFNKKTDLLAGDNEIFNTKLTEKENEKLDGYYELVSKLIKYSKVEPKKIQAVKNLENSVQKDLIIKLEAEFYERNKLNERRAIDISIKANSRKSSYYSKIIDKYASADENNIKLPNRRKQYRGRRVKIDELGIDKNILNKVLEVKFGSSPINSFYKNYNSLSFQQKSDVIKIVTKNRSALSDLKNNDVNKISNFYNGEVNKKLIDNYKDWLHLNRKKIINKSTGIVLSEEEARIHSKKEELKEKKIKQYSDRKTIIENDYKNQTKLKNKLINNLKVEFKDVLDNKNKIKDKQTYQLEKPSLRNNTIVNDSYLQFLNYCINKKICIPEENINDVRSYIKIVDICKNTKTENNVVINRDIIKNLELGEKLLIDNKEFEMDKIEELEYNDEVIQKDDEFINNEQIYEDYNKITHNIKPKVKKHMDMEI